jgi:hypothetical protein
MSRLLRWLALPLAWLPAAALANGSPTLPTPGAATPTPGAPASVLRSRSVLPLAGGLDAVPVLNDNNPELIRSPGILLSTFAGAGRAQPSAHLDHPLNGRFDLFSHHVYAGRPESLDSTLWLAVVAQPRGDRPVRLQLLAGSTALSQSPDGRDPAAPFLPLPTLLRQSDSTTPVWSGPGSRVATELLERRRASGLPEGWTLAPGQPTTLLALPLPVRGLDPLLNGRNLQLQLLSDGPVDLALLAAPAAGDGPPSDSVWSRLLEGGLSPREHAPTPRGAPGAMIYSRVSGVQAGSRWQGRLTAAGASDLPVSRAPISWPIASLERGSLGTGQVQTAPLAVFYPGTAWAAHGNYGVTYDLQIPLRNDTDRLQVLALAFESPLKHDKPLGGLRFAASPSRSVTFRGTVEVSGLDGPGGRASGRQAFHLVLRAGEEGPPLGQVRLQPGERRSLRVRLIYPADATPPQALSLLPVAAPPQGSAAP